MGIALMRSNRIILNIFFFLFQINGLDDDVVFGESKVLWKGGVMKLWDCAGAKTRRAKSPTRRGLKHILILDIQTRIETLQQPFLEAYEDMPHSISPETSSSPTPEDVLAGDDQDNSQEITQDTSNSHETVRPTNTIDASSPLPAVKDLRVDDDLLDDDDDDDDGDWPDSNPQEDSKDIPSDAPSWDVYVLASYQLQNLTRIIHT